MECCFYAACCRWIWMVSATANIGGLAMDMQWSCPMFADRWVYSHLNHAHGSTCCVWRIPSNVQGMVTALPVTGTTRAVLTAADLFIWRDRTVTHARFVHLTGLDGLRLRLAHGAVVVHHDATEFLEHFPFVCRDLEAVRQTDHEARRCVVERWLKCNEQLRMICSEEFAVQWYM
jgi:hypothetical protein